MNFEDAYDWMDKGGCAYCAGKYYILRKTFFGKKQLYSSTERDGEYTKARFNSNPNYYVEDWVLMKGSNNVDFPLSFIDVVLDRNDFSAHFISEATGRSYKWSKDVQGNEYLKSMGLNKPITDVEIKMNWKKIEW